MSSGETMEDLLVELGGLGKFQVIIVLSLLFNKISVGWSMLQMSFAGLIPDWYCLAPGVKYSEGGNQTDAWNGTLKACSVNNSATGYVETSCEKFQFIGESNTIINEWELVCDRSYAKQLVTSIQMAGVLFGALLAGYLGDYFGRKKTIYGYCLFHAVINIITAFSVSWEMFAACRFFIGFGIGGVLVMVNPYPMEFLPLKWRPIISVIPTWHLGIASFALAAMLLEDWSHLHLACGVASLPWLLAYLYVPESLRWLTVQGRIKEAEKMSEKMASVNNIQLSERYKSIIKSVAENERKSRENGQNYSYIDVFRGWYIAKITLTFCFQWFSLSMIYYGISFGVSSLAGNIYLNILLLALVELPAIISTFYFNNRIGRKWTAFSMMSIGLVSAVSCLITHYAAPESIRGNIITGLSLAAKMGIGAAWSVMGTWGTELYPTVTRNLGYGLVNTTARIGGILAPYLVNFDDMLTESYVIISALLLANIILILLTPETKGKFLADSVNTNTEVHVEKGEKTTSSNGVGTEQKELQMFSKK